MKRPHDKGDDRGARAYKLRMGRMAWDDIGLEVGAKDPYQLAWLYAFRNNLKLPKFQGRTKREAERRAAEGPRPRKKGRKKSKAKIAYEYKMANPDASWKEVAASAGFKNVNSAAASVHRLVDREKLPPPPRKKQGKEGDGHQPRESE